MASKLPRRPGDVTQRAKFIGDLATGQITQADIDALPPMGREISGQAMKRAVLPEQRVENGRKGGHAKARNRAAKLAKDSPAGELGIGLASPPNPPHEKGEPVRGQL